MRDTNKVYEISLVSICSFLLASLFIQPEIYAQTDESAPQNPVIWADVPDPSVIRVDDTYYMSSTTMHMNPGVPIMKSTDLVNWKIVNYVYDILAENDASKLLNGENTYGRGSWASSLKYHEGTFYLVTFSYTTNKTYIFQTDDIESGSWDRHTMDTVYHDPSLFFENGRAYLIYDTSDIRIIELTADVTAIKEDGMDQILIPEADAIAGDDFIVPAEGAHLQKIDGMYYVSLITWPQESMRTQLIYRSDSLFGEYNGKIALQDQGIAQGGLIDTPEGDWYAFLFQDNGAVGRTPYLVPIRWNDGWPLFGDNGTAPLHLDIDTEVRGISGIVASDEFVVPAEENENRSMDSVLNGLPLVWQWNHNPVEEYWSLTDRPGYLRLTNGAVDSGFLDTKNTLTQRTFGPECTGTVRIDISNMKNGDYAGLGALQENYGFIGIAMDDDQKYLVMAKGDSDSYDEKERILIDEDHVYLKISFNFKDRIDEAFFFYSLDGDIWNPAGELLNMAYTLPHFMGYRFALFSYATENTGGYVDFDYFRVNNTLFTP
ncbi:glycoside hydrolase [Rhodohalobacter sp. SW132]|uniref:glycoside hydrolase family 43 protein n=1 Tax=Rhodohalobacter sp. SW132 TaxID=2293433 RepID=UPI000E24044F|nr:glycoside hydrolase 43 family protein [Rhodohalobacter sp. SW132]REL38365.1 glycoside hydrolase [Rhodohalobacter sp. SW132]